MLPIITAKKLKRMGVIAFLIVLGLGSLIPSSAFGQKQNRANECGAECRQDLSRAAATMARFHQEKVGLADEFTSTFDCVSVPNVGVKDVDYINSACTV
jgi:hypothetical protein